METEVGGRRGREGGEGYMRRKGEKKRKREDNMCPVPGRLFRQQIFLIEPTCSSAMQRKCRQISEHPTGMTDLAYHLLYVKHLCFPACGLNACTHHCLQPARHAGLLCSIFSNNCRQDPWKLWKPIYKQISYPWFCDGYSDRPQGHGLCLF